MCSRLHIWIPTSLFVSTCRVVVATCLGIEAVAFPRSGAASLANSTVHVPTVLELGDDHCLIDAAHIIIVASSTTCKYSQSAGFRRNADPMRHDQDGSKSTDKLQKPTPHDPAQRLDNWINGVSSCTRCYKESRRRQQRGPEFRSVVRSSMETSPPNGTCTYAL